MATGQSPPLISAHERGGGKIPSPSNLHKLPSISAPKTYASILLDKNTSVNHQTSAPTKTPSFKPFSVNLATNLHGKVVAHPNFVFGEFDYENIYPLKPTMEYCGKKAILFQKSDKVRLINRIQHVLIGKFSHGRPPIPAIKEFFGYLKLKGSYNISLFDSKHMYIECELSEDYTRIWLEKLWIVKGFQMRVFKWTADFNPHHEFPVVPVWVQLHGLPLYLFEKEALLSIANAIGKPLLISKNNLNRSNLSFASLCVEIDVTKPLLDEVWIEFGKEVRDTKEHSEEKRDGFWQKLEYGYIPSFCTFCSHLDHSVESCKQIKFCGPGQSEPLKIQDRLDSDHQLQQADDYDKGINKLDRGGEGEQGRVGTAEAVFTAVEPHADEVLIQDLTLEEGAIPENKSGGPDSWKTAAEHEADPALAAPVVAVREPVAELSGEQSGTQEPAEGSGQTILQLEVNSVSQEMMQYNMNTVDTSEKRNQQDLLGTKCNQAGGNLCAAEGLILDKKCSRDELNDLVEQQSSNMEARRIKDVVDKQASDCLNGALCRGTETFSDVETAAGQILQQLVVDSLGQKRLQPLTPARNSTDWDMVHTMNKDLMAGGANSGQGSASYVEQIAQDLQQEVEHTSQLNLCEHTDQSAAEKEMLRKKVVLQDPCITTTNCIVLGVQQQNGALADLHSLEQAKEVEDKFMQGKTESWGDQAEKAEEEKLLLENTRSVVSQDEDSDEDEINGTLADLHKQVMGFKSLKEGHWVQEEVKNKNNKQDIRITSQLRPSEVKDCAKKELAQVYSYPTNTLPSIINLHIPDKDGNAVPISEIIEKSAGVSELSKQMSKIRNMDERLKGEHGLDFLRATGHYDKYVTWYTIEILQALKDHSQTSFCKDSTTDKVTPLDNEVIKQGLEWNTPERRG